MGLRRRQERKANGQCWNCTERAKPGRIRCAKHIESERVMAIGRMRRVRIQRREEDRCIVCGYPLHPEVDRGHVTCLNCNDRRRYCR